VRLDILTRNNLPYTFENFAALRLEHELKKLGVHCKRITDLHPYLYEIKKERPDWTIAFEDLLGWQTPLCDILALPHFHWERNSLEGLDHLMRSPHCQIGFREKVEGIHHLPMPVEKREPLKKIFNQILFLSLDEGNRQFVESFQSRIDIFGDHKGKDWLVRLKNREQVYLHMPLPFAEQLRALSMSRFVVMEKTDPLYPFAIAGDCLPISGETQMTEEKRRGEVDRLTKMVIPGHSWEEKVQELLRCLSL